MQYKIILVLAAAVMLSSCKKFLQLTPDSQISASNFYNKKADFDNALLGAYATERALYSTTTSIYLSELSTDNTEISWSSPSTDEMQFDQNALTPTNAFINSIWRTCLTTIAQCNTILARIDAVDFDAASKDRIKGETKFLRAFNYFYLVRAFGNIPITDKEFKSPEEILAADLTLQPAQKVYDVIISDLTSAETLLPVALNTDKTKASSATAKALLGKVYLTQHDYAKAAAKLKEVIDLNQYSLVSTYKTLFTNGNNNLSESIFEIEFVSGKSLGNNYSAQFTPAITSMAIFTNNLQGGGRIVPTLDLIKSYEAGDLRKSVSVSDSVLLISGQKSYARYGLKFVDFKAVDLADGTITYTVLRYADVLLMYAEALNELNSTAAALDNIKPIRARAGLAALPATLDQAAIRLALEKERRVEFLYEGHRWFDLVRTGRAKAVLNAHYASQGLSFSVEDYELIFPIPQSEIDLNPAVKQNPNY
jgi:tetratricopeptide (TPR) repeat protein